MSLKTKLFLALLLKSLLCFLIIEFSGIGLAPDEAQYWTWSQYLDWGYYSKPPAIAWQIKATTALFGNTEWGVRSGSILIGFFLSFTIFYLAKAAHLSEKKAFWAALLVAFSPLGFFLSMMATTDPGVTLFFILAILTMIRGPHYLLTGLCILCGALYKWTAFAFWPFVLISLPFYPHLRKKTLLLGILISLCGLLPSLYWNSFHEWATFKHVAGTASSKAGNFFDFLGAQVGIISPVLFILFLIGIFKIKREFPLIFCTLIPCGALIYLVLSLFTKIQPNWTAYLYPSAFVIIAWISSEKWLKIGLGISITMIIAILTIPFTPLPYKMNPFRQNLGWDQLTKVLEKTGYTKKDLLFADKYQTTSILSFYSPDQKRAYFLNLHSARKNQFSYWGPIPEGGSGYFVMIENMPEANIEWHRDHYLQLLPNYFKEVTFKGAYPLYKVGNVSVKYALIFYCERYNGKVPVESGKF